MQRTQTILPLAGALILAAACSNQKANPNAGVIHISSSADARVASAASSGTTPTNSSDTATETVCAQFSLQPYAPAADGTPQPSGSPIVFTSTAANANDASAYTDQILGCIDGTPDGDGFNWGYIVTVTDFTDCEGNTLSVSPTILTLNVPVNCEAGIDVEVPIHADVAIATPNLGGYVDISAGVNATDVQIGCKQADINSNDNLLHFGESYISTDGGTQQGLVGLDTGIPTQFGGWVSGVPATDVDTYYTGDISPTAVSTIYQTFLSPCASGAEYADTDHAQCVTTGANGATGAIGSNPSTVAELADAFAEVPGQGFAAVSVTGNGLTIYSSMGATGPNIMNAAVSPFVPSYNVITTTNLGPYTGETITGVYIDQSTPLQFLVAATVGSTPEYATLSYTGTPAAWTLGSFSAPTAQTIQCNGLYAAPASCFTPAACSQPADCPQEVAAFGKGEYMNDAVNTCHRVGSSLTYSLPEMFCTDTAQNVDFPAKLGNQYGQYVLAYETCNGTCAGVQQPSSCADLGGPGCAVNYPGGATIQAALVAACTAATVNSLVQDEWSIEHLFPLGYCEASQQGFQAALPTAYDNYVAAYVTACGGSCEPDSASTCAVCQAGLQAPSACTFANGVVTCPSTNCCAPGESCE